MYKFRDVTEVSEGALLPSEALKINGEYIENLINGYRTLSVSGREALSPDVVSETVGISDGSRLKSKRYPERIIIVKYQLIAKSNEEFREAYNKLAYILNVEDAELIFNDEQDKFFKGTPCIIGSVPPGLNSVVAEFEILCTDPFKYSVIEYEAEADLSDTSILIDYNGTYKAYPILQADFYKENEVADDGETETALTGAGDCGYVAFFTEDEKIVQLGNPEEVDTEEAYPKSQTLIGQSFNSANSWGSTAKKLWAVNSGITTAKSVEQVGNVGVGVASVAVAASAGTTSGTLTVVTSKAEAPDVIYTVKAKTSGRTASQVKVNIAITAALGRDSSYFGHGFGLKGSVYIGGSWHDVTVKKTSDYWRGKTGHTVNLTVTVTGLTADTTALTGIKFKVTRTDSVGGKTGIVNEMNCAMLRVSTYTASTPETYYLKPTDYGTGLNWHGASITRVIPADKSGEVGAVNCTLKYLQKLSIGSGKNAASQYGGFEALLVSGSGSNRKIVAGISITKGSPNKTANLHFYVNGTQVKVISVDVSYNNKHFASNERTQITKSGSKITFSVCGKKYVFTDSEIKNTAVNEITFTFTQFGTRAALAYNGLYSVQFIKNNCETLKDIPNKFSANDVVEADCSNGEITLNGVSAPELGALGNDWETFCLTPGLNQIGIAYSEWVNSAYAPTFKVRYREVFI